MRIAFAVLLILHGLAHAVGFVVPWQLGAFRGKPFRTTLLAGRIDLGVPGSRALGLVWLLTGIAFIASAVGVWTGEPWSLPLAGVMAALSLLLSVLGWPESRLGVAVNVLVLALLFVGSVSGWPDLRPGP